MWFEKGHLLRVGTIIIVRHYRYAPFGKHYRSGRRQRLGTYNEDHYDACPYAAKNRNQRPDREFRRGQSELTDKIKLTLVEQFDRVIYLLEKQLSIKISRRIATDMLGDFIAARGWQYGGATTQNIPWIFAYFSLSKSLFGQKCSSPTLQQAISDHYPEALWVGDLLKSNGGYLSPRFCFLYHHRQVVEQHLSETITFSVSGDQQQVIFEQVMPIDGSEFSRLQRIPEEKSQHLRQWHWVELAREVFNERGA
jgi:hypothetical protein